MNEKQARRAVLILACLLVSGGLWFTFQPQQQFFAYENRYLQRFPELSWQTLGNGQFTKAFETYVTDHFPARQFWLQLKGTSEWLLGKAENNEVYFGADNWLFEVWQLNETQWQANLEALSTFSEWAQTDLPATSLHTFFVPTSSVLYPEALPWFTNSQLQQQQLTTLPTLLPHWQVTSALTALAPHTTEPIYFQTDHHWTQLGAFYGYQSLATALGFEALPFDFWQWSEVSNNFTGSYYAKASQPWYQADTIQAAFSPTPLVYLNFDTGAQEPLYSNAYLNRVDQYGYFLNGTPAFAQIQNPQQTNGKRLVILKDSYAHVLAPLLAEHYESVTLIDLRFFTPAIRAYLQTEQFDQLLFLAGTTTFNTDMQLGKLQR